MATDIDLLLNYPTVLPVDEGRSEYRGVVTVNNVDFEVHLVNENGWKLLPSARLHSFEETITQLNQSSYRRIPLLLDEFKRIVSRRIAPPPTLKNLSEAYRHVLVEYVELREFYINIHRSTLAHDLQEVRIAHADGCGRVFDLVIGANCGDAEDMFEVAQHSLPEKENLFARSNSLKVLYERFVGVVEQLQSFFDVMDWFDGNCWVLDPDQPARKDCYRRIQLDTNTSVIITVDPWNNAIIPDIKFLGPERTVQIYRRRIAANLANWTPGADVVGELLKLLGIDRFPAPPQNTPTDEMVLCGSGECCVCFSERLDDKLPEIICPNSSCEQFFHKECLYQWLVSVNAKQSFNELHGDCPNCEKHITCPI